jgi:hypothetical protein
MSFKNELERRCFEIAVRALGGGVTIAHNKTIQIETALFPEVASFRVPLLRKSMSSSLNCSINQKSCFS